LWIGIDELAHFSNNAKVRKNDSEWVTYKTGYVKGVKSQDTSDPEHFGPMTFQHHQTGAEVSRQFGTSADTSALVPNCLDLQQTFFCYNRPV